MLDLLKCPYEGVLPNAISSGPHVSWYLECPTCNRKTSEYRSLKRLS